ncbi:MAG: BamA/TamA family outer membrane protein [Myxococcales bacterium]|nr:BamA/TamA family outer membrane protein [Myxococcales bacterium]
MLPLLSPRFWPGLAGRLAAVVCVLVMSARTTGADDAAEAPAAPATPLTGEPEPSMPAAARFDSFAIAGILLEDEATLHAVLTPDVLAPRESKAAAELAIRAACARLGYEVIGLLPQTDGQGTRLVLTLEPLPQIRRVDVKIKQSLLDPLLDDEIARRLGIRRGAYLPYGAEARQALFRDEQERIAEYFRDQGYFEAKAVITSTRTSAHVHTVTVQIDLGPAYKLGKVRLAKAGTLYIAEDEVLQQFRHAKFCLFYRICVGQARFTRSQLQTDIDAVVALYQARGYPGVKISSDFDPRTSFDRRTKSVDLTLEIDERRPVDVVFRTPTGVPLPEAELRRQLTFNEAASADDYESSASEAKLRRYLQGLGYFDAFVSWSKERLSIVDRIVFDIDLGVARRVDAVEVVIVAGDGTPRFSEGAIKADLSVEPFRSRVLTTNRFAISELLQADRERIRRKYAAVGYPNATVEVDIAHAAGALGNPALVAGDLATATSGRGLHIRFRVDEGLPDTIDQLEIEFVGDHTLTCEAALSLMQASIKTRPREKTDGCIVASTDLPNIEAPLREAATAIQAALTAKGFLHAEVLYEVRAPGPADNRKSVRFTVTERNRLRIGKVIVRGNFLTKTWVLRDELGFAEGELLTGQLYSDGPARLRSTNLFGSVIVDALNFDDREQQVANVLVRVVERHDRKLYLDFEGGFSTQNGLFGRVSPRLPNLFGVGIAVDGSLLLGVETSGAEANARLPRWVVRRALGPRLDVDLTFFARSQQTERFGRLTTQGGALKTSRTWQRPQAADVSARSISLGFRYDYRRRNRDETTIRLPVQATTDARVPVIDITGLVGLVLNVDTRTDRSGELNPLAPVKGYRVELGASYASPYLLGQDTFAKLYLNGQWMRALGSRLALRLDLRHDHGIPLGGAVFLPEVERYFAGGDNTVRGYAEDRLAVEEIALAVPPLCCLEQIIILPAGGNIRTVGNIDLEIKLARLGGFASVASGFFFDTGAIVNNATTLSLGAFRSAVGVSLLRLVTPFGTVSADWALPLYARPFDRATGRFHLSIALRN